MPRGLYIGAAVRLVGLTNAPELNNVAGRCVELDIDTGRWIVKLISGSQKSVKPENLQICVSLQPGAHVRVGGLVRAAHLNGRLGACIEWSDSSSRWLVRFDNGEVKAIRPENLEDWRRGPTNADQRAFVHSRARERSRSRSRRAHEDLTFSESSGSSILTFGTHHGRQYEDVFMNEVRYCQWAMSCPTPRGDMLRFVSWLRQQFMSGRALGAAARPPRPLPERSINAHDDRLRDAVRDWLQHDRLGTQPRETVHHPASGSSFTAPGIDTPSHRSFPAWHRGSGAALWAGSHRTGAVSERNQSRAIQRTDVQQVLGRLPRVAFKSELFSGSPYPDACPVCLEDWLDSGSEIVLTTCLHVFHATCLGGWLTEHDTCPSCRWNVRDTGEEHALNCSRQAATAPVSSAQAVDLVDSDVELLS